MKENRSFLLKAFQEYTSVFDTTDERISLKIDHTYNVAANIDYIARKLELCESDIETAWSIGMHDIGRFEQVARTHSFIDSSKSDHADEGVEYLFGKGEIRRFIPDIEKYPEDMKCIRLAIANHNRHVLPDNLTEREKLHCTIIRDADKLDIFRICTVNSFESVHEYPKEEVASSTISQAVVDSIIRHETVNYAERETPADIFVGHIAMAFGLEFPFSRKLAIEQGYLRKMADFEFCDEKVQSLYEKLCTETFDFLNA